MKLWVLLLAVFLLSGQSDPRAASTWRMAEMLERIYAQQDFKTDPNKAAERAVYYRELLAGSELDVRTELRARNELAEQLLVAGDSAAAVDEIGKLRKFAVARGIILNPAFDGQIRHTLAIAYLRMGEQQNCLSDHNAQSCIYPIRGRGVHQNRAGAEGAVREWTEILEKNPNDLSARWMLNLAYMTLGRGTQRKWAISADFLKSEYEVGTFQDVAAGAGVALTRRAGGAVAEDFDGDGYFDLIVSSSGPRDQLRYLHNNGDGTFSDQTAAAGLIGETGGLNVIHADYNNDGYPDIVVLRGGWWAEHGKYPFSLLRNNGPDAKGQVTFTDVTEEAGMLSLHPTQTGAWADFDGDGWLDLFVGHESNAKESHPSELWRNNHDGTFTNVAPKLGLAELGYVKGVAWGDFNNDGRPDLYVSRKGAANSLFRNDGVNGFTDVTKAAGVAEPVHSFGTIFFDYDNDGWLDLLVLGYFTDTLADIPAFQLGLPHKAEVPRLYHNNGDGTFRDVTKAMGMDRVILPMGFGCGDLDNDGWLDCYFGTGAPEYETLLPNRMFRNDGGRRFQDVTQSGGFGQLQKGHAVSFADFNRDGHQDIFEVLGGAFPGDTYVSALLANPGHAGHWFGLKLEGVQANRSALGARVRVELLDGRQIHRVVQPGGSFGDSPLELHIGLGGASKIRLIEVQWPGGRVQRFEGPSADQIYRLREGDVELKVMSVRPYAFRKTTEPHQHPQ